MTTITFINTKISSKQAKQLTNQLLSNHKTLSNHQQYLNEYLTHYESTNQVETDVYKLILEDSWINISNYANLFNCNLSQAYNRMMA